MEAMNTLGLIINVLQLIMIIKVFFYTVYDKASFGTTTNCVDNAGVPVIILMNFKGNYISQTTAVP